VRLGAAAADIALFAGAPFCGCFAAGLDVVVVEERLGAVEFARLVVGEPLSLAFARVREDRHGVALLPVPGTRSGLRRGRRWRLRASTFGRRRRAVELVVELRVVAPEPTALVVVAPCLLAFALALQVALVAARRLR
jgi:hypothetical protein